MNLLPLFIDSTIKGRHEGYVADYCTFCCEIRLFVLGSADWNVSFAGIDSHQPKTDFLAQCQHCGFWQSTELERYISPLAKNPASLSDAIDATFPTIRETYSKELAFEQRIRDRKVIPSEVQHRILNAVRKVDTHIILSQRHNWRLEVRLFLTPCIAFGSGLGTYLIATQALNIDFQNARAAGWLGGLLALVPTWLSFHWLYRKECRASAALVLPLVALSLAQVRPSQEELNSALTLLRQNGITLARLISAEDILREFKPQGFAISNV